MYKTVLTTMLLIGACGIAFGASAEKKVTIDASKTGEPISKYIYGQFIEHLGRCIQGGLWSEMLEDRKFFYPVTGEAPAWEPHYPGKDSWQGEGHTFDVLVRSPWMILGPKMAVRMDREHPYAGEHTPVISIEESGRPTGIQHERLGLVQGRSYVGRIVLAADKGIESVSVSLMWGDGASDQQTVLAKNVGETFSTYALNFTATTSTDNGRLRILGTGKGHYAIGAVSLMPADNISGWRADTVALLKELNSPVYRWPGGNFVSGYNWKDGVGDPDKRPPRKNPAWLGIESNDVGMHEYMSLMREIDAEPFISVNTGLGGIDAAAEQVQYANGTVDTPMGKLRAEHGDTRPFGVKFWAIGNEMYGDWQIGHIPLEEYVKKHNGVVDAMRVVDPGIVPVAVGSVGKWSETMLANCADRTGLVSEHAYWQDKPDLIEHILQPVNQLRHTAEMHRQYRKDIPALQGKDIRIAMDEWNYWYGPAENGEIGPRYFLQDALGIAAGLHEYFRNSDIFFMANYAQTVNVIGCIKTTATSAAFDTTGLVLKMYRQHYGDQPLALTGDFAPLDVAAARDSKTGSLTIGVVNPTEESERVAVDLSNVSVTGKGMSWTVSGASRRASNRPGQTPEVVIESASFATCPAPLEVKPLSVTLFRLETR